MTAHSRTMGLRKLYATVIELCTSEARRVNDDLQGGR